MTIRSARGNGKGFNSTASATLNTAVDAPMPRATVTTPTSAKPRDLERLRHAYFTSRTMYSSAAPNRASCTPFPGGLESTEGRERLPARRGRRLRERALEQATGLSSGVEQEAFDDPKWLSGHGAPTPRTFAQAEADLIASIRHATVGGTLPEWTGRRLDGTEEPLSAYRGRMLPIDFWATWCAPCITVLPDLRALVADLPADRFALLAISVDDEVETVTEFMKQEAMPWYNWHLGISSDLERVFDVRGFPTYLLADEDGTILFKGTGAPAAALRCLAERAVAGGEHDCEEV